MSRKLSGKQKICMGAAFGILILIVVLNVAAWSSRAFCDAYIAFIFPIWLNTYGRLTGLFPFSIGEWLLAVGIVLVFMALLLGFLEGCRRLAQFCIRGKRHAAVQGASGTQGVDEVQRIPSEYGVSGIKWRKFLKGFYSFFIWVILGVGLIMTLNCTILYHASTFSEKYYGSEDKDHSLVELVRLYNLVAVQCNELCAQMERDESGNIIYPGSGLAGGRQADMKEEAIACMQHLGEAYPQLDGFYPRPKAMFFSDFMCQQGMQGWYFPFTLEANYNDVMCTMRKPATMCHELAHLRGYIYEDEANFISFLACTRSDDVYFQYSGYLSVLNYISNDVYRAQQQEEEALNQAINQAGGLVSLKEQVFVDNTYVSEEEWERINGKALLDTRKVDAATDIFLETNLKANGVADGRMSYSRVVRLLLQYYDDEK